MKCKLFFIFFLMFYTVLNAQHDSKKSKETSNWYTELGFTVSKFEQQVKKEVGGAKGDLISDETNF